MNVKSLKQNIKKIKYFVQSLILAPYYRIAHPFFDKDSYRVVWDVRYNNFGDILTPFLLKELTSKKIRRLAKPQCYPYEHYFIIGSILERVTKNTVVWGSGFISDDSVVYEKPKKICAVRGPKTRKKLLDMGIECPEIYGDPALLLPKVYFPHVEKKYKLGVIPHYVDKHSAWLKSVSEEKGIKIIDVQVDSPEFFINEVLSCERIASSSLHGIITADAYSIPSIWLEFSNKVKGDGFKFFDYFLSVGRKDKYPLIVEQETKVSEILECFYDYAISIDLDKLLSACPLRDDMDVQ